MNLKVVEVEEVLVINLEFVVSVGGELEGVVPEGEALPPLPADGVWCGEDEAL